MLEHEEIAEALSHFKEARKIFDKYKGKWFSGNDNHIGDIGEYWAMRYFFFLNEDPELAPKKTSPYDFKLKDGRLISVKTMSKWNKRGSGSRMRGITNRSWDNLIAIKLTYDLGVEKMCIIPHEEVEKRIKDGDPFKWWQWLNEFIIDYRY